MYSRRFPVDIPNSSDDPASAVELQYGIEQPTDRSEQSDTLDEWNGTIYSMPPLPEIDPDQSNTTDTRFLQGLAKTQKVGLFYACIGQAVGVLTGSGELVGVLQHRFSK